MDLSVLDPREPKQARTAPLSFDEIQSLTPQCALPNCSIPAARVSYGLWQSSHGNEVVFHECCCKEHQALLDAGQVLDPYDVYDANHMQPMQHVNRADDQGPALLLPQAQPALSAAEEQWLRVRTQVVVGVHDSTEQCPICLEGFAANDKETNTWLGAHNYDPSGPNSCAARFHYDCMRKHLTTSDGKLCPCCNKPIGPIMSLTGQQKML